MQSAWCRSLYVYVEQRVAAPLPPRSFHHARFCQTFTLYLVRCSDARTARGARRPCRTARRRVSLISSPHTNYIGIYRLPVAYIAADLGLSLEAAREALDAVIAAGLAAYDEATEFVWVVDGAAEQIGELRGADKRVPAAQRDFERVPEGTLADRFYDKYARMLQLSPRGATPVKPAPVKAAPAVKAAPKAAPQSVSVKLKANRDARSFDEVLFEFLDARDDYAAVRKMSPEDNDETTIDIRYKAKALFDSCDAAITAAALRFALSASDPNCYEWNDHVADACSEAARGLI